MEKIENIENIQPTHALTHAHTRAHHTFPSSISNLFVSLKIWYFRW